MSIGWGRWYKQKHFEDKLGLSYAKPRINKIIVKQLTGIYPLKSH
jgi:hypothetical protein